MTFWTNYSGINRYLPLLAPLCILVSGCSVTQVAAPGRTDPPPSLTVRSFSPDKGSPQTATMATVRWKVEATGGAGEHTFEFLLSDGTEEKTVQRGIQAYWDWSPREAGTYRVKAVVRDSIGNTVDSGWSSDYRIEFAAGAQSLIAVMPVGNLTGKPVPVKTMWRSLVEEMRGKGLRVLQEDALEMFLERHRIRYTGGLNGELGEALRKETGAEVALFVSLEMFEEASPPKVALLARLVSTHGKIAILWADGVGIAGNDSPGLLLLGLINDPRALWHEAQEKILTSLMGYLSGKKPREIPKTEPRYAPKNYYGVPPQVPPGKKYLSVAVLPFRDESARRNSGEIMMLQFIRELSNLQTVMVVEPGVVRQSLLRTRTIMQDGLSLPQADLLHAELNVDLVLTGIVTEYQDSIGGGSNPKVEFSTRVFDMETRQIIWSSSSYNEGDDRVFFFNLGKVNTANKMAAGMVRSVVGRMNEVMQEEKGDRAAAVSTRSGP